MGGWNRSCDKILSSTLRDRSRQHQLRETGREAGRESARRHRSWIPQRRFSSTVALWFDRQWEIRVFSPSAIPSLVTAEVSTLLPGKNEEKTTEGEGKAHCSTPLASRRKSEFRRAVCTRCRVNGPGGPGDTCRRIRSFGGTGDDEGPNFRRLECRIDRATTIAT